MLVLCLQQLNPHVGWVVEFVMSSNFEIVLSGDKSIHHVPSSIISGVSFRTLKSGAFYFSGAHFLLWLWLYLIWNHRCLFQVELLKYTYRLVLWYWPWTMAIFSPDREMRWDGAATACRSVLELKLPGQCTPSTKVTVHGRMGMTKKCGNISFMERVGRTVMRVENAVFSSIVLKNIAAWLLAEIYSMIRIKVVQRIFSEDDCLPYPISINPKFDVDLCSVWRVFSKVI